MKVCPRRYIFFFLLLIFTTILLSGVILFYCIEFKAIKVILLNIFKLNLKVKKDFIHYNSATELLSISNDSSTDNKHIGIQHGNVEQLPVLILLPSFIQLKWETS